MRKGIDVHLKCKTLTFHFLYFQKQVSQKMVKKENDVMKKGIAVYLKCKTLTFGFVFSKTIIMKKVKRVSML